VEQEVTMFDPIPTLPFYEVSLVKLPLWG